MVQRADGATISVNKNVVMWHSVLQVDYQNKVVGIEISNNPLIFDSKILKAQVVMHKTASTNVAKQVSRFLRRRYDLLAPAEVIKHPRPIEAMLGYACAGGLQHPPNERTPGWGVFQHIAITPIRLLLEEEPSAPGATRIRYTVYEVRCDQGVLRGITNKMNRVLLCWRQCPPDTLTNTDVVHVGRYADYKDAEKNMDGHPWVTDRLWTRKPSQDYLRRILKIVDGDLFWVADSTAAVRTYGNGEIVCVGPHSYPRRQIQWALEHGEWLDGRTSTVRMKSEYYI